MLTSLPVPPWPRREEAPGRRHVVTWSQAGSTRGQVRGHAAGMTTDLFSIAGKTALVTGGSRGIGLMIARGYVEAGAKVYISSRKADVCEQVAAELSESASASRCRPTCPARPSAERLADEVAARESQLDILVNNAGATWGAPLEDYDEAAWDKVLALNVKGVFHLTKFLVPLLEKAGTAEEPAGSSTSGRSTASTSRCSTRSRTRRRRRRCISSPATSPVAWPPWSR